MGILIDIINSDKKLTAILIVISFIASNVLTLELSPDDPRRIQIEVQFAYSFAASNNFSSPFRPYMGNAKSITMRELRETQKNSDMDQLTLAMAKAESKVDWDEFSGPDSNNHAVQVVNKVEGRSARGVKHFQYEDSEFVQKNAYNKRATRKSRSTSNRTYSRQSTSGNTSRASQASNESSDENRERQMYDSDGKALFIPSPDPGTGNAVRGQANMAQGQSSANISRNTRLIATNTTRTARYEADPRHHRNNYETKKYRKMEGEDTEDNEEESIKKSLDDLRQGQNDLLNKARDKSNKSNSDAGKSSGELGGAIMMFIAGAALIIAGILLYSNPLTMAAGIALIAAGIAVVGAGMMMMMQGKKDGEGDGNSAGDQSGQAGSMYNDGMDPAYSTNDYVNDRLEERDEAVNNYSRDSYQYYGRGDVRNKQRSYRKNLSSINTSQSSTRRSQRNDMRRAP